MAVIRKAGFMIAAGRIRSKSTAPAFPKRLLASFCVASIRSVALSAAGGGIEASFLCDQTEEGRVVKVEAIVIRERVEPVFAPGGGGHRRPAPSLATRRRPPAGAGSSTRERPPCRDR